MHNNPSFLGLPPGPVFREEIRPLVSVPVFTRNMNDVDLGPGTGFRLQATTNVDLTGIGGGTDGRIIQVINVGTPNITLKQEDSASRPYNRVTTWDNKNIVLQTREAVRLRYDGTSQRWRQMSANKTTGGGGGGGSIEVHEDGVEILAAAERLDFKDANVEDGGSNRAHVYLDVPSICTGRLTPTSGTPVPASDVSNVTTIYFTPYGGNRVSLYDGTRWKMYRFTELSIALGTLTSGKNYDIFLYDNAGTLTLEFSAAWTNDSTRADALTTQNGVLVKSGATTRRYLGTFRTTSTTQTQDTETQRFIVNYYNRMQLRLFTCPARNDNDAATTFTTTSTTYVQANSGTGSKVEWVSPFDREQVSYFGRTTAFNSGTNATRYGIGENSSTTAAVTGQIATTVNSNIGVARTFTPALGYNFLDQLIVVGAGTGTYNADTSRLGGSVDPFMTYVVARIPG